MPDIPGTPKSCVLNFFSVILPMYTMKVFAYGTHIPQHICLEENYDRLFSHFHKIHAGTLKHFMHKNVHLMSHRIICRKRGFQKRGIMWKGVRMTWMVWLKSSIMLNYSWIAASTATKMWMVETWDRDCYLCAANRHATFPVMWASKPHHGTRTEYFQEWHARLILESCISSIILEKPWTKHSLCMLYVKQKIAFEVLPFDKKYKWIKLFCQKATMLDLFANAFTEPGGPVFRLIYSSHFCSTDWAPLLDNTSWELLAPQSQNQLAPPHCFKRDNCKAKEKILCKFHTSPERKLKSVGACCIILMTQHMAFPT